MDAVKRAAHATPILTDAYILASFGWARRVEEPSRAVSPDGLPLQDQPDIAT
jgi:hypothetical protein